MDDRISYDPAWVDSTPEYLLIVDRLIIWSVEFGQFL